MSARDQRRPGYHQLRVIRADPDIPDELVRVTTAMARRGPRVEFRALRLASTGRGGGGTHNDAPTESSGRRGGVVAEYGRSPE